MSETTLPEDQVQPALNAPTEPATPVAQRRGNGLAILALLLGAAGVAAGGWGVWQVRNLQALNQQQLAQLQTLGDQAQGLKLSEQRMGTRLDQMPPANELEASRNLVAQLQRDQQHLSQRLETVLWASKNASRSRRCANACAATRWTAAHCAASYGSASTRWKLAGQGVPGRPEPGFPWPGGSSGHGHDSSPR